VRAATLTRAAVPERATALASGQARLCALWSDLVTDGIDGSGVYHNSLPGREVITWFHAFESYDPTIRFTVQLQLVGTGEFTVWFHPSTTIAQIPHTAVCGASPGNVTNPGSTDFSAVIPYNSNTQATLYEQWATGGFDLAQRTFLFQPNGLGGWVLNDRPSCPFVSGTWGLYGAGCPPQAGISGASFYELFSGASLDLGNHEFELVPLGSVGYLVQSASGSFFTGYANAVPMGDDTSVDEVLPFPFANPGGVCTTAGFCSNGFVWMDNFNNGAPAAPYVPGFLSEGPRIAAMWTDIDLTAGGAAYYDATPAVAYFTWVNAPDYYNPSLRSTFQIQLFADGRIKLCYQSLAVGATRPVLAGYGLGGQIHDPGSVDMTASVPFSSGTGSLPVTLDWRGMPPVLGRPFPMETGNPAALRSGGPARRGRDAVQPPACHSMRSACRTVSRTRASTCCWASSRRHRRRRSTCSRSPGRPHSSGSRSTRRSRYSTPASRSSAWPPRTAAR
jgi:hypothetical protein